MVVSYTNTSYSATSFTVSAPPPPPPPSEQLQYLAGRKISASSSFTKPTTNTITATEFYETDTYKLYKWTGSAYDQYESFTQTLTNKTVDIDTSAGVNSIANLQTTNIFATGAKRTGAIVPACTAADSTIGVLCGLGVTGDGTPTWSIDATEGPVLKFSRASSGIMGFVSTTANTDTITTRCSLNPFFKIRCKLDTSNSTRLYIGFTSAASLPNSDTPLATGDSGVIWGFRTTDSNFSVINNDGTGAAAVTSMGIVKDTSYHTVSFTFSASNVIVVMDDGAGAKTQTIYTKIPATTTDIKLSVIGAY